MPDRGPDDRRLALQRCTEAIMNCLDEQQRLERVLDELHQAQLAAEHEGVIPPGVRFDPAMHAAWQVARGVAFWDREPTEPVPTPAP